MSESLIGFKWQTEHEYLKSKCHREILQVDLCVMYGAGNGHELGQLTQKVSRICFSGN